MSAEPVAKQPKPDTDKPSIYYLKDLDYSKFSFAKPIKVGNGLVIYLNYDNKRFLHFHFPWMNLAFDVKDSKYGYRPMLKIDDDDAKKDVYIEFRKDLEKLDAFLRDQARENVQKWRAELFHTAPEHDIEIGSMLDSRWNTVPLKFVSKRDRNNPKVDIIETVAWDMTMKAIDLNGKDAVEKYFKYGNRLRGINQLSGLYLGSDKLSITVKLFQTKIQEGTANSQPKRRKVEEAINLMFPEDKTEIAVDDIFNDDDEL